MSPTLPNGYRNAKCGTGSSLHRQRTNFWMQSVVARFRFPDNDSDGFTSRLTINGIDYEIGVVERMDLTIVYGYIERKP